MSDSRPPDFERLLADHLPELRAFIQRRALTLVSARESASDLAQSVCREVIEHVDRFQYGSDEGFRRWLYKTAERKILSRYRYYRADKRDAAREVGDPTGALLDGQHTATSVTPSRDAAAREELGAAEAALQRLPAAYRQAIVLSRVAGLSHAEIAERMGRSPGAVANLVHRGLAAIAEELGRRTR